MQRTLACYLFAISMAFVPFVTYAGGFRINLDNVSDLGNAFAGGAALTQDASVNAFNAAGLVFVKKQQLVLGANGVLSHTTFRGSSTAPSLIPPITTGIPFIPTLDLGTDFSAPNTSVRSNSSGIISSFYYNYPINEQLAFGISANVPFGLGLDFGENSDLRYGLIKATQKSINVAPSLSYLVTPHFSIGAGPDFQNYSLLALVKQNTSSSGALIVPGVPFPPIFIPPTTDSESKVYGSNWGYGGHIGVLYAPSEKTHIGLAYRSQVVHHVSGKSEFASGTAAFGNNGNSTDNFRLKFTVPPNIMLSAMQVIDAKWSLLGTIDYTLWNTFNYITTYNVARGTAFSPATLSLPQKFVNSWHMAVAANFKATDQWLLRFGLAYDQRPTNNATRTLEFPNGNLIAAGIGGRYTFNSKVAVDLGYLHSFIRPTSINHTNAMTGANQTGTLQTTADVFGLGLVWNIT